MKRLFILGVPFFLCLTLSLDAMFCCLKPYHKKVLRAAQVRRNGGGDYFFDNEKYHGLWEKESKYEEMEDEQAENEGGQQVEEIEMRASDLFKLKTIMEQKSSLVEAMNGLVQAIDDGRVDGVTSLLPVFTSRANVLLEKLNGNDEKVFYSRVNDFLRENCKVIYCSGFLRGTNYLRKLFFKGGVACGVFSFGFQNVSSVSYISKYIDSDKWAPIMTGICCVAAGIGLIIKNQEYKIKLENVLRRGYKNWNHKKLVNFVGNENIGLVDNINGSPYLPCRRELFSRQEDGDTEEESSEGEGDPIENSQVNNELENLDD